MKLYTFMLLTIHVQSMHAGTHAIHVLACTHMYTHTHVHTHTYTHSRSAEAIFFSQLPTSLALVLYRGSHSEPKTFRSLTALGQLVSVMIVHAHTSAECSSATKRLMSFRGKKNDDLTWMGEEKAWGD